MRNPLFQQTARGAISRQYPATTATLSYCPRCGRWFSGLAVAIGVAAAAFTGAGLAHADADTDPSRPAASASADTTTGSKDADQSVGATSSDSTKDADAPAEPNKPEKSDDTADTSKDDAAPSKSTTDEDATTDEVTDPEPDAEPVTTTTKDHSTATVERATTAVEKVTATVEEPEAEAAQAVTEEPAATVSGTKAAPNSSAKTAAVETVAVEQEAVEAATPEKTAPTVAIASTVALSAATTTTGSNWLADLFNSFFLSWQRMFNNATPTVPSQKVNITLTDVSGASSPIAFGGSDADGDPLVYTVTSGPKYGTVTIDQTTGTFTYNPVDSATVNTINDTFTVKVDDTGFHFHGLFGLFGLDGGHGATATITVVVNPVNAAPVANADNVSGLANTSVTGNVLANDTDREGTKLSATLVSGVGHGALTFAADGSFTYTPNASYTGQDTFTYTASDGTKTSAVATVTITVGSIPDVAPGGTTLVIGSQGLSWWRGLSDADINKALDMSKAAGITSMRIDISWAVDEATKGTYDWSTTDSLVTKILAHQMSVLGMIYDTPTWLSGSTNPHTPPSDPAKFAAFAAATAKHYLGQISAWEIWNEPNLSVFWTTGRDAAAYTGLLKAVYPAIKAVNPNAVVITGGLSPEPGTGLPGAVAYLAAMYAAGAAGYFDAVGLHPYYYPYVPIIDDIAAAHALMVAHGDGNKQIWMTELGAPTGTASNAVTEKKQALAIGKIVDFARQYSYIGPIYMYSLLDTGTDLADPEDNFGLLHTDFTAKLAWAIWLLDQEDLETLLNSLSL